ncbi:MAG: ABC transporter substrate-binding protein, partial [Streptosporangiaceae bacterium]
MNRYRAGLIVAAAGLVSVLAACSGSASSTSAPPAANQVFTYDTFTQVMVDGWDPATEYSDGIIAMSEMYETLTRYDSATHTVKPLLATSWSSAANGLTWTFHLRQGVHFHTGRL